MTMRSDKDYDDGRTITTEDYKAFHTKTFEAMTMRSNEEEDYGSGRAITTEDYKAFHSMVCSPQSARGCIESFTGAILFGSMEEYGEGDDDDDYESSTTNNGGDRDSSSAAATPLQRLDYRYTAPYFSVASYYLLVVFSLTGLCTLLGHTECFQSSHPKKTITVDIQDGNDNEASSTATKILSQTATSMMKIKGLTIEPQIFQYLLNDNDDGSNTTTSNENDNECGKVDITIDRIFEFSFGSALDVVMMHIIVGGKKEKHLVEVYRINTETWLGRI